MAYPFDHRPSAIAPCPPSGIQAAEWRCHECSKLLGVRHGARLHIRLQRHNYLVSLPVEATCPACEAKNRKRLDVWKAVLVTPNIHVRVTGRET